MSELKIAVSRTCPDCFTTQRSIINTCDTHFIDVAAAVLSIEDVECGKLDEIDATGYNLPVFIAINKDQIVPAEYLSRIQGVFEHDETRNDFYGRQLESAAHKYEVNLRHRSLARWSITSRRVTARLTAQDIRVVNSSVVTLPATSLLNTLAKPCSALTFATPTWQWVTC